MVTRQQTEYNSGAIRLPQPHRPEDLARRLQLFDVGTCEETTGTFYIFKARPEKTSETLIGCTELLQPYLADETGPISAWLALFALAKPLQYTEASLEVPSTGVADHDHHHCLPL